MDGDSLYLVGGSKGNPYQPPVPDDYDPNVYSVLRINPSGKTTYEYEEQYKDASPGISAGSQIIMGAGRANGRAFDTSTGTWSPIPDGNLTQIFVGPVWAPEVGKLLTLAEGRGAMLDVATGTWSQMAEAGYPAPLYVDASYWNGTELHVFGTKKSEPGVRKGFGLDPAAGLWRELSVGSNMTNDRLFPTSDRRVVRWPFRGTCDSDVELFDPSAGASGTWSVLSTEGVLSKRSGAVVAFGEDRLLIYGGKSCASEELLFDGVIYDAKAGHWTSFQLDSARDRKLVALSASWLQDRFVLINNEQDPATQHLKTVAGAFIALPPRE